MNPLQVDCPSAPAPCVAWHGRPVRPEVPNMAGLVRTSEALLGRHWASHWAGTPAPVQRYSVGMSDQWSTPTPKAAVGAHQASHMSFE